MIDKINGNSGYDFKDSGPNKKKNPAVRAYENTPGFEKAAKKRESAVHKKSAAQSSQKETGVILDLSGSKTDKKKGEGASGRTKGAAWSDVLHKLIAPVIKWLKNFWESDRATEQAENILSEVSSNDTDQNLPPLEASDYMEAAENSQTAENAEISENQKVPGTLEASGMLEASEMLEASDHLEAFGNLGAAGQADEYKAVKDAALKSGNLQQIERLVTHNGTKRLAHNSDLLTYYDRRGKFVEIDETEKHRVLFGDKNILKL